jgi:(p)ppGpp synthase/HD superfamily hydrolase
MGFLTDRAKKFAEKKHINQTRKFDENLPYISHPTAVAERLASIINDEEMIAAAFLHDTLEDTQTTYEEISQEFGNRVADLVQELTSDKKEEKLVGKAEYLTKKINDLSPEARLIKLLDREHNVSGFLQSPPEFCQRYAQETQYILDHINITPSPLEIQIIASIREKITPYLKS